MIESIRASAPVTAVLLWAGRRPQGHSQVVTGNGRAEASIVPLQSMAGQVLGSVVQEKA